MFTEEKKQLIKDKFTKKIGKYSCPMCQNTNFNITDGYILELLQEKPTSISLDYSNVGIPTIGLICDNCGFMSKHSLGAIMTKEEIYSE